MKKSIVIMLTLSVIVLMISCSENPISKLHWESHDGLWAINSLDESIPETPGHELKASPFEIAKTENHWESRNGAWAIRSEPIQVAETTVKTTFINQDHSVSTRKLHWESHDGLWAINSLDESIPETPGHELKASPFEIAKTENHWESRDGAWAIRSEPIQVAETTVKTTFINQDHSVSTSKLHWESHDGLWAINSLDESIPEIPGHELKASPFEIAKTQNP